MATKGYVGLGFSPNGGMAGSDIVLGWVTDGGEVMVQASERRWWRHAFTKRNFNFAWLDELTVLVEAGIKTIVECYLSVYLIFIGNLRMMFQDSYATGYSQPLKDDQQDVELLGGYQNDTHTVLRFSRPWSTCDEQDFELSVGSFTEL